MATKSTKVPKALAETYGAVTAITDRFCQAHLNNEYLKLTRYLTAALCRMSPSLLAKGRPKTWACSIVHSLGRVNFLYDQSFQPAMTLANLCTLMDVGQSTCFAKAREISKAIDLYQFHPDWTLPSLQKHNPLLGLEMIDGFIVPKPEESQERLELIESYRALRDIATDLQTILAVRVIDGEAAEIAVSLGLAKNAKAAVRMDFSEVAPALDLALFSKSADDRGLVERYLEEAGQSLPPEARKVAVAMTQAWFSVFALAERHPVAGVILIDMTTGEEHWVMDLGLEASMSPNNQIALRLFKPADFNITTGVVISMSGEAIWNAVERRHALESYDDDLLLVADRSKFAEAVYAAAVETGALVEAV